MQIERKIDATARVVTLQVNGSLGDQELLSLADELEKATEVTSDFSLLVDLRQANGQAVTRTGVRALVGRPLVLSAVSRRAIVVPSDLGFGMARMYEMLRGDQGATTRVFRDYDEALRWVGTGLG